MIDVDNVATDADLMVHTGGAAGLSDITPQEWFDVDGYTPTCRPARAQGLTDVLTALRRRTPPIRETELSDVTELRQAVVYRALEILYRQSVSHEGSPNQAKARDFCKLYTDEINALQPTTYAGTGSSGLGFRMWRG